MFHDFHKFNRVARRSRCCRRSRHVLQSLLMVAALAVAMGVAACGDRTPTTRPTTTATTTRATTSATTAATTPPTTSTMATTTTTATTAPTTSITTRATTSPTTTILLTEPQMAYLVSISNTTPVTVQLDYVEMYYGDEAVAMAKQDKSPIVEKDAQGKDFIPNDYYLRNISAQLRTFPLAANVLIEMLPEEGGADATDILTVAEFRKVVAQRKPLMEVTFNPAGTQIISLTEFYLP